MSCEKRKVNDFERAVVQRKEVEIDYVQGQVCTKYMNCIGKKQLREKWEQVSFIIPQSLLKEEEPIEVQVFPTVIYQNQNYEVEMLMKENIKRKKMQEAEKKKEEKQKRQGIKEKLGQINQKAIEIGKNCKKKQLAAQTRKDWNHSIFGQKAGIHIDQSSDCKEKQKDLAKRQEQKISMKPIDQRILEHRSKQQAEQERVQKLKACNHYHYSEKERKKQEQMIDVQQRADLILKALREQKEKEEDRRKIIKAKIKGIYLQSKERLKKFKKKPVDPSIQFVVEIQQKQQKKQVTQKKVTARDQSKNNEAGRKENRKKEVRDKKSPRSQKGNKTDDRRVYKLKEGKEKTGENQDSENKIEDACNKFYVWDIPIYKDDFNKIQANQRKQRDETSNQKHISFRDEVRQFLTNKFHCDMNKQNKRLKENRLQEMIRIKKEQLILQQTGHIQVLQEQFWNQDQIFKLGPISNFKQF